MVTSIGAAVPGGAAGGYTGGKGNWGASSKPGGGKGKEDSGIKNKKRTFKQQKFEIDCKGLKPNTVHKFFYEGVDRGLDCIPKSPKPSGSGQIRPGTPLTTDEKGRIEFHFYFTVDVERQVDAENKVKYELAGDKKFELKAENSSAFVIVPFKDHHKHHRNK
jgi:hypothetical protein